MNHYKVLTSLLFRPQNPLCVTELLQLLLSLVIVYLVLMSERKNPLVEGGASDRLAKSPQIENEGGNIASTSQVHTPGPSSSVNNDLITLLDFTSVPSDSDISDRFGEIARSLLYDYVLSISNGSQPVEYEFLEVEFYLRKDNVHEDPFTHGTKEQGNSGRW